MGAGRLRHRIRIDHRVSTEDRLGTKKEGWATLLDNVPADWRPVRGREFFAASQMQGELTGMFVIRYRAGIDETMRIVFNGLNYDISSPPVDTGGRSRWLELMVKQGVRDGR